MRRGTAVTIEAMFFLSLPNLAAAAVLECSREVLTCRMQMPVSWGREEAAEWCCAEPC